VIERANPERFKNFLEESQAAALRRYAVYKQLAGITSPVFEAKSDEADKEGE
jgi:hypothetical protein